jgi:hypothetical protein
MSTLGSDLLELVLGQVGKVGGVGRSHCWKCSEVEVELKWKLILEVKCGNGMRRESWKHSRYIEAGLLVFIVLIQTPSCLLSPHSITSRLRTASLQVRPQQAAAPLLAVSARPGAYNLSVDRLLHPPAAVAWSHPCVEPLDVS